MFGFLWLFVALFIYSIGGLIYSFVFLLFLFLIWKHGINKSRKIKMSVAWLIFFVIGTVIYSKISDSAIISSYDIDI